VDIKKEERNGHYDSYLIWGLICALTKVETTLTRQTFSVIHHNDKTFSPHQNNNNVNTEH